MEEEPDQNQQPNRISEQLPLEATLQKQGTGTLKERVAKQLEFYFSTVNLDSDGWLRRQVELTRKGWINIKTLLKFNRIRELLAGVQSTKEKVRLIQAAVKQHSKTLVCAKAWQNKREVRVRRKKRYRAKPTKKYETVWIGGVDNSKQQSLYEFLAGYTKILKMTAKQRWFYVDVENAEKLLMLNGELTPLSQRKLTVMTKQEYKQTRQDIKKTERQLPKQPIGMT